MKSFVDDWQIVTPPLKRDMPGASWMWVGHKGHCVQCARVPSQYLSTIGCLEVEGAF